MDGLLNPSPHPRPDPAGDLRELRRLAEPYASRTEVADFRDRIVTMVAA